MTDILEPSRKVKTLRREIYTKRFLNDVRLVGDALKEIQRECLSLEIQHAALEADNRRLVHEANKGKEDVEIAF